ncbi:addiction module protein [Lacunimicrobium album]
MISNDQPDLWSQALELSMQERADLALMLLDSLPNKDDVSVEQEWIIEIQRRREQARLGHEPGIPWEQVQKLMA